MNYIPERGAQSNMRTQIFPKTSASSHTGNPSAHFDGSAHHEGEPAEEEGREVTTNPT